MRINIYTNTQKSQFRQVKDGVWQILGIPITVDDAVMKGILYDKADNAAGLASYRDKVIVLRHPEDENGNGVSASSGKALMNHFSGGAIINTYNHNGVNYADAEFKEKVMLAQDNGEYYVNRLKNGLPIGISTGLFFDGNNESGVNGCGEEYHARAKNQQGDHVAMLPDEEPPAGGAATFIRFNGENDDQTITVNIDEILNADVKTVIEQVATNDEEKSLLTRLFTSCKRLFATDNDNGDNVNVNTLINNREGVNMRKTLTAALLAKGITANADHTEAELLGELLATNKTEATDMTAVDASIKTLTETVAGLQIQLTANADKELDGLAESAANHLKGFDKETLKAMGADKIHKALAENGVTVGAPNGVNHQSPEPKKESGINMEPWKEAE